MKHHYRPEIDGLRALAVLPVVFFHAGFPGVSGGYVGVDVFFVISGFLITSILVGELRAGEYSVARFYERRIRRIMPPLFVVVTFVLVASPFSLLPSEFSSLWKEALGAIFFVANIVFWMDSGYFSADAATKPLLHTWSLGIEEQFYIFAPLVLAFLMRRSGRFLPHFVAGGMVVSFGACILLTRVEPGTAFYLLPTRAWELMAGSLLAVCMGQAKSIGVGSRLFHEIAAAAGVVLIVLAVMVYSKGTAFPGYAAAVPVLGASLIIAFAAGTATGKLLSSKVLVAVGLISYSLYLWHWPLVVFFRNSGWLEGFSGRWIVVALSFAMAWMTWKFVEGPTRNRASLPSRSLYWLVIAGVLVIVSIAVVYRVQGTKVLHLDPQVSEYDAARDDISPSRKKCHIPSGTRSPDKFCSLGGGSVRVAVWADSHGVELAQALSEQDLSVVSITYSACRPGVRDYRIPASPDCDRHNRIVHEYLKSRDDLDAVILVANYGKRKERLSDLVDVARSLQSSGKRVIIVGPTPVLPGAANLPTHLARGGDSHVPYGDLDARYLRTSTLGVADIVLPEEIFCSHGICDMSPQGRPLLFDGHHPSMSASRRTAAEIVSCMQQERCG